MKLPRSTPSWLKLGLATLVLAMALVSTFRAAPTATVLHPVAPPLTRLAALGDLTLDPTTPSFRPPDDLRLAVQTDAIAIAHALGPKRAAAAVTHRETLSAETATWDAMVAALEAQ